MVCGPANTGFKKYWARHCWVSISVLEMCTGSRVPVLPVRTSGRRVQNSTRNPKSQMTSCTVHVCILCKSTQCEREGVHCGVTMETLPNRVTVVPVENYPNPISEENATRLSTYLYTCRIKMNCQCKKNKTRTEEKTAITEYQCTCYEL